MYNKVFRSFMVITIVAAILLSVVSCKSSGTSSDLSDSPDGAQTVVTDDDGNPADTNNGGDSGAGSSGVDKNNTASPGNNAGNSNTNNGGGDGKPSGGNSNGGESNSGSSDFHSYTSWKAASGTQHTSTCADCNNTVTMDHIWNDGVVTTNPTTSKSGAITFTCQICGHKKTEAITYTQLNGDGYSSGRKTAEVYQAAQKRDYKVYGAAYSDGDYCALYGECPNGLCVLAQTEDGCYAVNSSNGCYALRMSSKNSDTEVLLSFWYNGKQIGEPMVQSLNIMTSSYDTVNDDGTVNEWKPMIGYNNLGYFTKILDCYKNTQQISSSESASLVQRFKHHVNTLKSFNSGSEIICVLAPASVTVYPESVPKGTEKVNTTSYYDQFVSVLEKSGITALDLRDAFNEHKNDKLPLYNNYDTHWTDYGAYIAYVELYNHISKKFPAAKPLKFEEFKWERDYFVGGDMPSYFGVDTKPGKYVTEYGVRRQMASSAPQVIKNISRYSASNSVVYDAYSDEVNSANTYRTNRSNLPDVCVIRNSFGTQIYDLIAERSNVSQFAQIWGYNFDTALYSQMKPDYLIYVFSEWEFNKIR